MEKRTLLIFLILLSVFNQSGCWDRHEIETLGLVNGIAIEPAVGERLRVTMQVIDTAAISKGGAVGLQFQKAYRNVTVEDDTPYDAIRKLSLVTSTKRFLAHNQIIIISEELARQKSINDILDFFNRDNQVRFDTWLLIGRGNLVSLMDVPGRVTTTPSQRIADIVNKHYLFTSFAPLRLGEFLNLLQNESTQPYTAVVQAEPNLSVPTEKGHGLLSGNVPEPEQNIIIRGTAVFKKDKMIGYLDDEESQGLLWLRGEIKQSNIKFSTPESEGKEITTQIVRSKTQLQPQIIDGQIYIKICINADTFLEDIENSTDLTKAKEIKRLEAAQSQQIIKEIRLALNKAQQEYQVDIFGFGEALNRKYPREWKDIKKDWSDLYPGIQVSFQVKTNIMHTSLISKQAQPGNRQ